MADILSRGAIIVAVAAQVEMPQTKVDAVIKAFENAIARQLASGGEVRMVGLGTFKVAQRSARVARNPRTGKPVQVPARSTPRFKAGKALQDAALDASLLAASSPAKKASAQKSPAKASAKISPTAKTTIAKTAAKGKKK